QESLLGDKFIDFIPTLEGSSLPKIDGVYQVQGQDFSDWMTMLSGLGAKLDEMKLEVLAANINDMVVKVKEELFSKRNLDNISLLLTDASNLVAETEDMMKKINASLDGPEGILTNAQGVMSNTNALTAGLKRDYPVVRDQLMDTMKNADKLLDSGNVRINRVGEILDEANPKLQNILSNTERDLPALFAKLDKTLKNADVALQGADQLVRNQDLKRSMYDLSVVLQEMTLTLRSFRADPSQVLFGGPGQAQKAVPDPKNKIKDRTEGKPARYGY
ncbi:MAG: ABC-type transporter Mla subunit MlaD, partial [Planctomycetota bacterium]